MGHRFCAWSVYLLVLCVACSSNFDQSLENRACSPDGKCLPGYECSQDNVCLRSGASLKRYPDAGTDVETAPKEMVARDARVRDAGIVQTVDGSFERDAAQPSTASDQGAVARDAEVVAPDSEDAGEVGAAGCVGSECPPACAAGATMCNGRCVELLSDAAHCGACGVACVPPAGGEARCVEGKCEPRCLSDQSVCDSVCVKLADSTEHCGDCHVFCGEGQRCMQGVCRARGVDVAELDRVLRPHGYNAEDFARRLGIEFEALEGAHVTLADMERAGISRARLAELGISLMDLERAGIDVSSERDAAA